MAKTGLRVTIQSVAARRLLAVKHRGPYADIGGAFEKLDHIARRAGLHPARGAPLVAVYFDDAQVVPAAKQRAAAGLVLPRATKVPRGLHEMLLPKGLYARTLHRGPYETLGQTWGQLIGGWLPTSGYRLGSGPSFELYLNTPATTNVARLRTELYASVTKQSVRPSRRRGRAPRAEVRATDGRR